MNTLTLSREQSHPPLALSTSMLDRAAVSFGLSLIRWARQSELARSERLADRRRYAVSQYEAGRLRTELANERARIDSYMLFRALP